MNEGEQVNIEQGLTRLGKRNEHVYSSGRLVLLKKGKRDQFKQIKKKKDILDQKAHQDSPYKVLKEDKHILKLVCQEGLMRDWGLVHICYVCSVRKGIPEIIWLLQVDVTSANRIGIGKGAAYI